MRFIAQTGEMVRSYHHADDDMWVFSSDAIYGVE